MKEEKEKKAQEIYAEYQAIEQHVKQLQKQLEVLTNQLMEMTATGRSLEELDKTEPGKEILVPLSSGIFVKGNLKNTSELLVNVGANVVVEKDLISAKKLINGQLEEMKKLHMRLVEDLEKTLGKASELESELKTILEVE